jgi:hypothetical protein
MNKYQNIKVVEAGYIEGWLLHPDKKRVLVISLEGGEEVEAPQDLFARYKPVTGDVLVRYADGWIGISPRKAFDEGYTEIGNSLRPPQLDKETTDAVPKMVHQAVIDSLEDETRL